MINLLETLGTKLKITRGNCDYCNQVGTFPVVEIVPLKLNNRNIYITHGQRGIPALEYQKGDIICLAHTHMGHIEKYHDLIICNSGSISLPRGGTKSSYLEINDKEIILFQSNGKIIQKYILE